MIGAPVPEVVEVKGNSEDRRCVARFHSPELVEYTVFAGSCPSGETRNWVADIGAASVRISREGAIVSGFTQVGLNRVHSSDRRRVAGKPKLNVFKYSPMDTHRGSHIVCHFRAVGIVLGIDNIAGGADSHGHTACSGAACPGQ